MKRVLSILLALCLSFAAFAPLCHAADGDDVVRCTGWYLRGSGCVNGLAFEVVLDPRFTQQAGGVVITNSDGYVLEKVNVYRKTIDNCGECFVIDFITDEYRHPFRSGVISAGAFRDDNGNGNATIRLSNASSFTKLWLFQTSPELADAFVNDVPQGEQIDITFAQNGTVRYDGEIVAQDTQAYTLSCTQSGEHTLEISVNDFFTRTYRMNVQTESQRLDAERAALQQELSDTVKAFFASIPLAILTLPLLPLCVFGFLWPVAPIEIGSQIFDILARLRKLK